MSREEIKDRLLAARGTTEDLLAQIHELYVQDIRSEKKLLKDALSELHNSGNVNLVELLKTIDRNICGHTFFTILHAFENVLPSLEANVEDVLHCLVNLTHQAGRDLAIGGVFSAFQCFCSLDDHRSQSSIEVM